eukprot:TRINITY_DN949_c0_g1_i1.p1 TRINITY_DN949_c0_g1~~TRINITY_DN949_c0_g1_i1.p1  ORF type:complete len:467 (-),score=66.36 TRINITY_DN949_c0_g1_i1:95-1474(-)
MRGRATSRDRDRGGRVPRRDRDSRERKSKRSRSRSRQESPRRTRRRTHSPPQHAAVIQSVPKPPSAAHYDRTMFTVASESAAATAIIGAIRRKLTHYNIEFLHPTGANRILKLDRSQQDAALAMTVQAFRTEYAWARGWDDDKEHQFTRAVFQTVEIDFFAVLKPATARAPTMGRLQAAEVEEWHDKDPFSDTCESDNAEPAESVHEHPEWKAAIFEYGADSTFAKNKQRHWCFKVVQVEIRLTAYLAYERSKTGRPDLTIGDVVLCAGLCCPKHWHRDVMCYVQKRQDAFPLFAAVAHRRILEFDSVRGLAGAIAGGSRGATQPHEPEFVHQTAGAHGATIAAIDAKHAAIDAKHAAIDAKHAAIDAKHAAINIKNAAINATVAAINIKNAAIDSAADTADRKHKQEQLADLTAQLGQFQEQLADLKVQLAQLRQDKVELYEQLARLERSSQNPAPPV